MQILTFKVPGVQHDTLKVVTVELVSGPPCHHVSLWDHMSKDVK